MNDGSSSPPPDSLLRHILTSRVYDVARDTPLDPATLLSARLGTRVHLKREDLQPVFSFKLRGAYNKIAHLTDRERSRGIIAASAGNHAQAVAWAAREAGLEATIFMPEDTPVAKVEATQNYGAQIELGGEMFDDAYEAARSHADACGATFVHPYEDDRVIAGQGTIGVELAEQLPQLSTVVVPIGGGGLASGIGIGIKELRPDVHVVGVQAAACAPFAGREDYEFTIAEGIAVKKPGELTRAILRDRLDDVVTVTEDEIAHAIVLLLERVKLVVEGAGATPVAALLAGKVAGSGPACALLSGGNIDPSLLVEVARYSLTHAGRFLVLRTHVPDRPGELAKLLSLIAAERVNVIAVQHQREGFEIPLSETGVELTLQTRDEEHCGEVIARMQEWGYDVERLR